LDQDLLVYEQAADISRDDHAAGRCKFVIVEA